ncbi:hypothetical protein IVB18_12635 [Bradyrhizobium sp. 186]|uniref:hypothetical protein n=1 Tax=Bradyrhizobium sp. 186 TaxID=2782654 RepID=UPI0020008294|nr:hypothetical protein [Bradyrhizobium sp. 186]UPK38052.1 hypothetical protein IVB18_12635 [Bradyrhizobium sp. 186]
MNSRAPVWPELTHGERQGNAAVGARLPKEFADLLLKMIRHRLGYETLRDAMLTQQMLLLRELVLAGKSRKTDGLAIVVAKAAAKLLG